MYSSKKGKKGQVEIFDESFYKQKMQEQKSFNLVQALIQSNDINIVFQPVYRDSSLYSIEALARLNHPELSLSIGEIILLARKFNFQRTLFDRLFVAGIKAYSALLSSLTEKNIVPKLNINIDIEQLSRKEFATFCLATIQAQGLNPQQIYLEITENALEVETKRIKLNIQGLKDAGFKLSMDDFGTGYSSIRRLIGYDFDQLKIDRSFINGAPKSQVLKSCLTAAVQLGKALNIDVLSEGIETQAEFNLARELGIDKYQGFYFCKPKTASDIIKLLNKSEQFISLS